MRVECSLLSGVLAAAVVAASVVFAHPAAAQLSSGSNVTKPGAIENQLTLPRSGSSGGVERSPAVEMPMRNATPRPDAPAAKPAPADVLTPATGKAKTDKK